VSEPDTSALLPFPAVTVQGVPGRRTLVLEDLGEAKLIGSAPDCDLQVSGENVSPIHAQVVWDMDGVVISDASSVGGTFVNQERLAAPCLLQHGDGISLGPPGAPGSARLLVSLPPSEQQQRPPEVAAPPPPAAAVRAEAPPAASEPPPDEVPLASLPELAAPEELELEPPASPGIEEKTEGAETEPAAPREEAPAAAPAARAAAAEYLTEPPSIAPISPRPAAPPPAPLPAFTPKPIPRRRLPIPLLVGVGVLALAGVGYMALRSLHRPELVVAGLTPPSVQAGQDLSITGEGFDPRPEGNLVFFGDKPAQIVSASEGRVVARTPPGLVEKGAADVGIRVEVGGRRSSTLKVRVYVAPKVSGLDPPVALSGEEVTVEGANLEGSPVAVTVAGVPAEVLRSQADAVVFRVPTVTGKIGTPQPITLLVGRDHATVPPLILARRPFISDVLPPRATLGQSVILRGYGFDPEPAGNEVRFGDRPALVIAATLEELLVAVPPVGSVAEQRELEVEVTALGVTSMPKRFELLRASTARYLPRFFAAVVPGQSSARHVFVATDLSPVLLISGAGAGGSVAQRASKIAERMNAVVAAAASQPITLRVLSGPPRIVASDRSEPIVTVTDQDADAFAQPWAGGRRATPQLLADYWAAVLQDYLLLFVERDRPFRTLQLRPEGDVFTKLHADAVRLAGVGGGVPLHLVSPLASEVGEVLRRLSLSLPSGRAASGIAALVGRWRGTMALTGQAPRAIQLDLSLEGSRLQGTLATRVGKVSGRVSVRDVAYQGGVLDFAFDSGGNPLYFRGRFEGAAIEGTVYARADRREGIGSFSLGFSR